MKVKADEAKKARAVKIRKENKLLEDGGGAAKSSLLNTPVGKREGKSSPTFDPSQVSKVWRATPR